MLVLSRKLGERIKIGETVVVTVVEIHRDRVKLAFDAPREIPIHREEVFHRIQAEQLIECNSRNSRYLPEFA